MFLKYKLHIMLLIVMLSIFPELAWAQNLFDPVPEDKSIEVLSKMFGKLGVFGPSDTDAFSSVISAFNSAVLVIGGVLVAYTIFIGTIGTAHDGEMLGKKFSSAWVPIRTALGTAVVLPIIEGSYCIMQAIVGWLIVQGVGLADLVWKEYMSSSNIAKQVVVNSSNVNLAMQASWKIFASSVCMKGYEKVVSDMSSTGITSGTTVFGRSSSNIADEPSPEAIYDDQLLTYYYGATNPGDGFQKDSCGQVSLNESKTAPSAAGAASIASTGFNFIKMDQINTLSAQAAVSQKIAFEKLLTDIDEIADDFVSNPNAGNVVTKIKEASVAYSNSNNTSTASILAELGNFQELEESSTKDGWMLAGAWYMRMSYLMDAAARLQGNFPEATGANMEIRKIDQKFSDEFYAKYGQKLESLNKVSGGSTGVAAAAVSQSDSAESGGSGVWDFIKSGFNFDTLVKKLFIGISDWTLNDGDHPVMAMKGMGNWIIGVASGGLLAYLMGSAALLSPGIAAAVQLIVALLFPPMLAVAVTLSFVLPMMPFMIWIGAILGWIILCVEAILAAPMWAVMHLSPHGDDMVGTGSQGYRLVLSLMLRPVLMVFGLIAALTIITVVGKVINEIFASVFILSQQDSNIIITVLGTLIVAPLIYLGLMWTLITKTMSIIHVIPDQLLQWFGGGGAQLGDYGNTIGGTGSQTFAAAATGAALGSRGIDVGKQFKDFKAQQGQIAEQKASVDGDKKSRALSNFFGASGGGAGGSSALSALMNKDREANPGNYQNSDGSPMSEGAAMEKFTSSQQGLEQSTDLKSTIANLGGESSALAQDFSQNFNKELNDPNNKGATFGQIKDKAMAATLSNNELGSVARMYAGMSANSGSSSATRALGAMISATSNMTPAGAADVMNNFSKNVMQSAGGQKANYSGMFTELSKNGIAGGSSEISGPGVNDNPGGSTGQSVATGQTSFDFGDSTQTQTPTTGGSAGGSGGQSDSKNA